jgi:hypothetical protein
MPLVPLATYKTPRRAAAGRTNQVVNMVAPVGGLNLRDPISAMAPTDALVMDNMIPRPGGLELRGGYKEHCVNLTGDVGSLFAYIAGDNTTSKLFASIDGDIVDVTTSTPSVSQSLTGSTDDLWFTTQFSTGADTFLLAVSTTGGYWTYSTASGWVKRTPTNLPTNPKTVVVWKRRLWFTCENDTNVYYMDSVNAITGTVTAFPMGAQLRSGGYIACGINWTMDAGESIDDYLVFIGTQGDVVIWQGTDPTNAATFAIKGVWYVGPVPTKGTFWTPMGGDVMIVSTAGVAMLSAIVRGTFDATNQVSPASKILPALRPLVDRFKGSAQWAVLPVARANILVIKPPQVDGNWVWYVMDLATGSWCRFTSIPSYAIASLGGVVYTAYGTTVYEALGATTDGETIGNAPGDQIEGDVLSAFNSYGAPANLKKWSMVRPSFISSSPPSVKLQINTQYNLGTVDGTPGFPSSTASEWDTGVWGVATWFGAANTFEAWAGSAAMGYIGALRMRVRGAPATTFTSYVSMFDVGGVM